MVEHCKLLGLHLDLGPDRPLFWYTTANWMMWNIVVAALLVGAPIVLYDGSPTYPDPMRLWRIAADHQAAVLGVSPGYLTASAGEMSAPLLGVALESWDDHGRPRTGQVGELVVKRPMPSMPRTPW